MKYGLTLRRCRFASPGKLRASALKHAYSLTRREKSVARIHPAQVKFPNLNDVPDSSPAPHGRFRKSARVQLGRLRLIRSVRRPTVDGFLLTLLRCTVPFRELVRLHNRA